MAPLTGVTILDLTHVLAGPYASHTLQDLGAKVIKVERPVTGDDTRAFPPFVNGESGYFAALNAGVHPLGVGWGFHTPDEQIAGGAVHVAADFTDLEAALERFAARRLAA